MRVEIPTDRPTVELPLHDGTTAILCPMAPEDRPYLVEGLGEMSLDSRIRRFGQGRDRLTAREWDYLSDIDQRRHVAWVAVVDGYGAGVGRYIIVGDQDCAEVAMTVLDRFQGKGVGTALFLALLAVARADGLTELCFEVLPSNEPVLDFLASVDATLTDSGGLLQARLRVDDAPPAPVEEECVAAMRSFRGD
jgi:GNAT superfamily N-acetyltransferase